MHFVKDKELFKHKMSTHSALSEVLLRYGPGAVLHAGVQAMDQMDVPTLPPPPGRLTFRGRCASVQPSLFAGQGGVGGEDFMEVSSWETDEIC